MSLKEWFVDDHIEINEEQADRLSRGPVDQYVVEVEPPRDGDIPATLERFIGNTMEIQSKWFGLRNASPVTVFEIRRSTPDRLQLQYAVPTKRLERKVRTQLTEEIPGIGFNSGASGLPVTDGATVGGGVLTVGREDYHPLRTDYQKPPFNSVVAALHRHAMQDTKIIIQVLFQPLAGHPFRRWWWNRNAYKQLGYLRKEKPDVLPWHDRPATPQEKKQANQIEEKARQPRFQAGIRILVIGAKEYTRSRVKEVAGSFNTFEDPVSNQYLDTYTVTPLRSNRLVAFADAVRKRSFNDWIIPFQATAQELAALVSIPDRTDQKNIRTAQP